VETQTTDLVEVALPVPSRGGLFTYRVPAGWLAGAVPGRRALVPLGKRLLTGVVVGPAARAPDGEALRDVVRLLDEGPLLPADVLSLVRWASRHYLAPLGLALKAALPPGIDVRDAASARLTPEGEALVRGTQLSLDGAGRGLGATLARIAGGTLPSPARLAALEKRGLLVIERAEAAPRVSAPEMEMAVAAGAADLSRAPKQAELHLSLVEAGPEGLPASELPRPLLRKLVERGAARIVRRPRSPLDDPDAPWGTARHEATPAQAAALAALRAAIEGGGYSPFLLDGVTGSGKTWVYLEAIAEVRARGRGALVLVPEIALTPQLAARFRGRFGDDVAVLHSGLSDRERLGEWRRVRSGGAGIVVGARSAIFAPVERLGIVVVDEEHEPSYKQEDRLRYHARDLALVRAREAGAVAILGSATPSLETVRRAREGKLPVLALPKRVDERPMPAVEIVDLKPPGRLLTPALLAALQETLARRQQAILFLNRRGHTTALLCASCGLSVGCPNCSVALVLHRSGPSLQCHLCGHREPPRSRCPQCDAPGLLPLGGGTERVEEELTARLAGARIARLDRDAAEGPGRAAAILARFARGDIDVLVGTQMVAKGHDFPGVTLVGVLNADAALHVPDFRAAERCVQLLAQVAGRAGRGPQPGRVIVQALRPSEPAVQVALSHDAAGFASAELERRRALGFPPYARLCALKLAGNAEPRVRAAAERLAEAARRLISRGAQADVLGPAPAPLARLRGKFRWQLLLRAADHGPLHELARALQDVPRPPGVELAIDVDPISLM